MKIFPLSVGVAALLMAATGPAHAQATPTIGAAKAVAIAEKAVGGRAVEAELDRDGGRLTYDIELVRDGALYEAKVDARSGQLLASGRERVESLWARWFDKSRLQPGVRPLSTVLTELERETGGRVEEAGLDSDGDRLIYEVELATAAGVAEIMVDPVSGRRLPAALD